MRADRGNLQRSGAAMSEDRSSESSDTSKRRVEEPPPVEKGTEVEFSKEMLELLERRKKLEKLGVKFD